MTGVQTCALPICTYCQGRISAKLLSSLSHSSGVVVVVGAGVVGLVVDGVVVDVVVDGVVVGDVVEHSTVLQHFKFTS